MSAEGLAIQHSFRVLRFAKPSGNNVLQPSRTATHCPRAW